MRVLLTALMIALLALPAAAQFSGGNEKPKSRFDTEDADRKKQREADEKAAKAAMDRVPAPDKKFDPWAKVRQ